jgi:hypothetical protein
VLFFAVEPFVLAVVLVVVWTRMKTDCDKTKKIVYSSRFTVHGIEFDRTSGRLL